MDTLKIILVLTFIICTQVAIAAQPALPTTIYGAVQYLNNTPSQGSIVFATWLDAQGRESSTRAVTISSNEAAQINSPQLTGFYFFNKGFIQAQPGTSIKLHVENGVSIESIDASPGGQAIIAKNLYLPDITDAIPPKISNIRFIPEQAAIAFDTNEPASAKIAYGELNTNAWAENKSISLSHNVILPGLEPFKSYIYSVIAKDTNNNTNNDDNSGQYYTFETGSPLPNAPTPNQLGSPEDPFRSASGPADFDDSFNSYLGAQDSGTATQPTKVYGQVTDEDGDPVEDVQVTAIWEEFEGLKTASSKTFNSNEAEILGDPDLSGYYFFNQDVTAPDSSNIKITTSNDSGYLAIATAKPGLSSKSVLVNTYVTSAPPLPPDHKTVQSDPAIKGQVEVDLPKKPLFTVSWGYIFYPLVLISIALSYLSLKKFSSRPSKPTKTKSNFNTGKATQIMTKHIVSLKSTDTLYTTMATLLEHEIGGVLVTQNKRPIGWVTEQTITESLFVKGLTKDSQLKVSVKFPIVVVKPKSTYLEIYKALTSSKSRHAVVINNGKLTGVVSITDLAKELIIIFDKLKAAEPTPIVQKYLQKCIFLAPKSNLISVKKAMIVADQDFAIIESKPPSIVTERDIMEEIYINRDKAANMEASLAAKSPVKQVRHNMTLLEANELMLDGFRRFAVFRHAELIGIITQESVVAGLVDHLSK